MAIEDKVDYYIDISAYNLNTDLEEVLRFGTADLTTKPTDDPANTIYTSRVIQPGSFKSYMFGQSRLGGSSTVGSGRVVLNNIDGGLDYLDGYAFGGRVINIWRVVDDDYSSKTLWFSGNLESALINYEDVVLRIRDKTYSLSFDIQSNKYLGNNVPPNGIEGGENDIKDTPKPLWYGRCRNVTPILVNFSKLIYQCHDGSMESISNVYDGQTSYTFISDVADNATLQALTVNPNDYYTCLNEGLIRLGTKPQRGVTVDGEGDNNGGYINTAGAIVRRIINEKTELSDTDLDLPSFSAFDVSFPYEVGIFLSGGEKVNNVIDTILGPLNSFYFNRSGTMFVDIFSAPGLSPVITITDDEIIKDGVPVRRVANNDDSKGVPVYSVNYQWGRNYTIQTENDVYGSVGDDVIAFTSQEYRVKNEEDLTIKTKYPLSPEITVTSQIYNEPDAVADSSRILDVYKTGSDFYQLKVESQFISGLNLNDNVELVFNRFGLEGGKVFKVTGIEENAEDSISRLEVYG